MNIYIINVLQHIIVSDSYLVFVAFSNGIYTVQQVVVACPVIFVSFHKKQFVFTPLFWLWVKTTISQIEFDSASQKVFGHSSQIRLLKQRFEESGERPLAVFVKGPSGSGKSMLVQTALDDNNRGFDFIFLSGKFEKVQSGNAYSVLVEAFSSISWQDTQSGTSEIRKSLRENSTLLQIIPSLQVASALGQDC